MSVPAPEHDSAGPDGLELLVLLARLGKLNDLIIADLLRTLPHPEVHGYGQAECIVLTMLAMAGPPYRLTPTELCRVSLQSPSGMTKTLGRLADAGLAQRLPDENDRRSLLVQLTAKGLDVALGNIAHTRARYAAIVAALAPADLADSLDRLRRLLGLLEDETAELRGEKS